MYKLAIIGETQAQLNNPTLREWLRRAGLICHSGWGLQSGQEDVWFGTPENYLKSIKQGTHLWMPMGMTITKQPEYLVPSLSLQTPLITLGQDVTHVMTGYNFPILKVRGTILPWEEGWLAATLDPNDFTPGKQDELKPLLGCDARRAIEVHHPRLPKVSYLDSPRRLSVGPGDGDVVSVDIEGANGKPNIVGVAWSEEEAFVFPWGGELKAWLTSLFETHMCTFHNGAYDVPELEEAGVKPPKQWLDTIVMAALYDPVLPLNLQAQVLTHVPGSVAWKGLINHANGPDYVDAKVKVYRGLWDTVLTRLGRPVPVRGWDWYVHYNGLDTAWGLALANNLKAKLKAQGRWGYYEQVLMPLQQPLLQMGQEGMPLDMAKLAEHQEGCLRRKEEARVVLVEAANRAGIYKPDKRKKPKPPEPMNVDSPKQLAGLLYDYYGLPVVRTPKGGRSVSEDTIEGLISRVTRGTVKVKGDTAECLTVLREITAYNHWGHWIDTFLNPPVGDGPHGPSLLTTYSLHRTITGRLSSGLDTSDLEKGTKKVRKQQVQNVPKELRDMVAAPEGYIFIGGDYSGIEWAIAMWYVGKVFNDGYHVDMLDRFYANEFDPHDYLAGVAGCPRQVAKVFTHGYNYDGSPRTLARNAGLMDSVGVDVCKAHDKAFRTRPWKDATVKQAKKEHKIQTPLGWRCYTWAWNPKPQEILAWLVQGTAADLCKWVMKDIFTDMLPNWRLVTSTHDSFLLQVPVDEQDAARLWLKVKMQQPIPWLDGRHWRADIKTGKTWRDVS